ncbi:MAG: S1C family serine protease [Mariniblastus sp.]|nr:S1C family serine protease [Mariniblastus sp.]
MMNNSKSIQLNIHMNLFNNHLRHGPHWTQIFVALAVVISLLDNLRATDDDSIRSLKIVGERVIQVVDQNREACVALIDGYGSGSGVIVSSDGLVLTAGHVIEKANLGSFMIILSSGRRVKAKPLGHNLNNDLGMAQILEPGPWPHAKINRKNDIKSGDWVVSLGHSGGWELGRDAPVRTGRFLKKENSQLVTDAVLIGGDSGGPLFNLEGEVVGIHSSIGDSVSENRHIPIEFFIKDWDRLNRGEKWGALANLGENNQRRPLIGVTVDLSEDRCLVKSVYRGSPADAAGIKPGDVITEFGDTRITSGQQLIDVVRRKSVGTTYPLVVQRANQTFNFKVTPQ